MAELIDTLLLFALPASGKSEVRTYLASLSPEQCREEFGLGPTVQLDDYPYVHLMRRIDQELVAAGGEPQFFHSQERPFKDPIEWGTLIELLNEDYGDLHSGKIAEPSSVSELLLERLERARLAVGGPAKLSRLSAPMRATIVEKLEGECAELLADKHAEYPESLEGKTIVMEAARGGAQGSSFPLPAPFGYRYALSVLSEEILARASILYIWVTPEESRRKNEERADPDDPGSILHHGVPIEVMLKDYGCDDMDHLIEQSSVPDTVEVEKGGRVFHLPVSRFDNRVDKTSFIRGAREQWSAEDVKALHEGLREALRRLGGRG